MTRKHFTLVEAVIATAITLIVLASATSLLSFNLYCTKFVDDRQACSNIAKNRLESLRCLTFEDLSKAGELNIRVNQEGVPDGNGTFFRSTAVGPEYWGSKSVTVKVINEPKYRKISGKAEVTLVTIMMDQNLIILGN